jgi:hypothetical protein
LTGLHLSKVIRSSLDQIGKAAGGTGLFALGLMIYGLPLRLDWQITACVLLKNRRSSGIDGAHSHHLPTALALLCGAHFNRSITLGNGGCHDR